MSIFFIFVINILNLFIPKIIAFTIDNLINTKAPTLNFIGEWFLEAVGGVEYLRENLYLMGIFLALLALLSAILQYGNIYWGHKASEILMKTMRDDLYAQISKLPFSFHSGNKTGDIIKRCTSDVDTVKNFLSNQIAELLRTIVLLVLSLFFMFSINLKLALIAVILLPVNLIYSYFGGKRIARVIKKAEEESGLLSAIIQENISGVRVVRAFGKEAYEMKKFEKQNNFLFELWKKANLTFTTFWSGMEFIANLQIVAITVLGSILAFRGELLAGEYVAFVSYNLMLSGPIMGFGRLLTGFSKAKVATDRISYIMNASWEVDEGRKLTPSMKEDIIFQNVSFSYDGKTEILKSLNFTVKAGETIGILGGTGSGKSTLMYLLTRLYSPTGGKITIGGVDIKDIELSYLRRNIGMVLQEPYLFSGSISENISLGSTSSTDKKIKEAARISSLTDTIADFSKGFDTFVGERGVTLSGGQKQRMAIARMIVGEAPIMLFDDSLSAVDTETDMKIRTALSETGKDTTSFIISHRITTLMNADKILVLDKGKIKEMGSHKELLAQNGLYRKIYQIQFHEDLEV